MSDLININFMVLCRELRPDIQSQSIDLLGLMGQINVLPKGERFWAEVQGNLHVSAFLLDKTARYEAEIILNDPAVRQS